MKRTFIMSQPTSSSKAFALLVVLLVASLTLNVIIPSVKGALPDWDGWFVQRTPGVWTEVTTAIEGETVQARWSVLSVYEGNYRVNVMRDAGLGDDNTVIQQIFYYSGIGHQEYSLDFVPPHLTGESDTQGYYIIVYTYGGGAWPEAWRMPDSYPPRLQVISKYALTINCYGSGTTNPAPDYYRTYPEGSNVVVTAIPAAGWEFYRWLLDDVDVGLSNPYTVTMDSDHSLTAVFIKPLAWSSTSVKYEGYAGPFDSCSPRGIALNSNDNPIILYRIVNAIEPTYAYSLYYANRTLESWDFQDTELSYSCWAASIVVDSRDIAQIACAEQARIVYGNWTGTRFDGTTIYSGSVGGYWSGLSYITDVALAIDTHDQPKIAFVAEDDGLVVARVQPNGLWVLEYVDHCYDETGYETIDSPVIALDSNDYPRVFYRVHTASGSWELRYAKWNGLEWSIDIVDSHALYAFQCFDMALDSEDHPHVTYSHYEGTLSTSGLRYAWLDGTTWNQELVHLGITFPGGNCRASLALDSLSRPHIAYSPHNPLVQNPDTELTYARRVSSYHDLPSLWVNQTVHHVSLGFGGAYPSIALDSLSNPHISHSYHPYEQDHYLMYSTPTLPNQAPMADANGPYADPEGVPVVFDGSGSYDPDGIIFSYKWDFGDGYSGAGASTSHMYAEAGIYTVTLTVTDDSGAEATDTTAVIIQLTITASAGSGGTINPSGSVLVNYGDDITFTITPSANYHILSVWVDTVYVGAVPSYTFTQVVADHRITAYFAIDQHTITASAGSGGTISPSGSVPVNYGADQTFTMTADPGYEILDVVVDGADHRGPIPIYTFYAVTADHSISASFGINNHDVAVIDVTPARNSAGKGYPLLIDVIVENQGARAESFNVTVYYGNSAITPEQWETFWSLGDVNRDGYINMTDLNLLSAAYGATPSSVNWNLWGDLNQDLKVDLDDIVICSLNNGLEIWTYAISGGVIGTQTVIDLAPGNMQTLTFTWDISGMSYGNYVVGAYAVPIMGKGPPLGKEVDRADNALVDGTVTVTLAGDIDGDGYVGFVDFAMLAGAYGSTIGQPAYRPEADIDGDGDVDYSDFIALAGNYGQHLP